MKDSISKFKIPTLLGIGVIIIGIIIGLYLVLREQVFLSQATPNLIAQDITITNISEDSVVISWQTNSAASSFITYGQTNPSEQMSLDDRDNPQAGGPKPHLIHYVTLKNLLPQTKYQFKITSGKITSNILTFNTAKPLTNQIVFTPIIGSVLDNNNSPLEDGVVYLSIPEVVTQSALIKTGGNFLIPLSEIRKADLSDYQLTENVVAKLTIQSDKGEASALITLQANSSPLLPIKLGQNIDLTTQETPEPSPSIKDLDKYDLNGDGKINAADNAIILQNFNKKTKNNKADLNGDGIVNQKDLDLMSQKLKEFGS